MAEANPRVAVLVLGMHRSGTSALAGLLSHMGYAAPHTQMEPSPRNAHGFFESKLVAGLNDDILKAMGSFWHDRRPLDPMGPDLPQAMERCDAAANLIAPEFGDAASIVLKDPRICRLAPIWIDALSRQPCQLLVVVIHRNPFEVALSLQTRNSFPLAFSLLVWLRHVLDAERATRSLRRAFTSYDQVLADWRSMLDLLGRRLAISFPISVEAAGPAVDAFLSADLRHFAVGPGSEGATAHPALLDRTHDCLEIMDRWAAHGEDSRDYKALDRIYDDLAGTGWTFVDAAEAATAQTAKLRESMEIAKARSAALGDQVSKEAQQRIRAEELLLEANANLKSMSLRNDELGRNEAQQAEEISSLACSLRDAKAGSSRLLDESRRMEQQIVHLKEKLWSARQACDEAKSRHKAVLASTSWPLSAPLRVVVNRLRKM